MSMFKWLSKLRPTKSQVSEVEKFKEISRRIAEKSDALQERFVRYTTSRDPSMALFADVYTSRQVRRIYHGLNGQNHG